MMLYDAIATVDLTTISTNFLGKIPSWPLMSFPFSHCVSSLAFSMIRSPAIKLSSSTDSEGQKQIFNYIHYIHYNTQ